MKYQPGVPCWIDLSTSDMDAAKRFYAGVFGWEIEDMGEDYGGYHMLRANGKAVGGMMRQVDDHTPVTWTVYLSTADVSESARLARETGADLAYEPMQVMNLGHMAVAIDPAGASFGLWQPETFEGFELNSAPGAPCWFQVVSTNFESTLSFYRGLFPNLAVGGIAMEGMTYKTLQANGDDKFGMMDATWLTAGSPSYWEIVLGVTNTDEAVAQALELGGSIVSEAMDTPWGRMAAIKDPQGAVFAIIQVA